ncbi:alanine racemase [Stakelama sp. CBK3Z-3]|uniref:Alanine racemase n=1 Tax=Stakelama flava TaxID=2860338 RepID=A0ABS6XMA3_9SPHN|nr:alanine racemase [Stakelama flava]MBW4331315.1 alanine racemase [Stakelama flava]
MSVPPLSLHLDGAALAANWRSLAAMSGRAACGAAVKADAYGLGAIEAARRLVDAGCRDFFVATWAEARELAAHVPALSVLHGVREADMAEALESPARPVLNTAHQVARWKEAGGGVCDVMVDTGMNRLGLSIAEATSGLLDGLNIDTLMSHLACADEAVPLNERQRARFAGLAGRTAARRLSLANSCGIALGKGYHFDLTRPGIALYGGVQVPAFDGRIVQVVTPRAEILQRRCVKAGETVGYNATWTAPRDTEVAILNLGYADGYFRGFSGKGAALTDGKRLPVLGRVSMDLTAVQVDAAPELAEGDQVDIEFALPHAAAIAGMSQYELLTGMGSRYARIWNDQHA